MIIISHRGNLNGSDGENHPRSILKALDLGFHVEVDMWMVDGKIYLGHDNPKYEINIDFISQSDKMWIHAKNLEVINLLYENKNINWFWHEEDKMTLTSKGYIWSYPGHEVDNCVMVDRGQTTNKKCYAICTDNPFEIKKRLMNVK